MDPTPVRRCVCMNVRFDEVLESGAQTLEEIGDLTGAGTKCGSCRPYLAACLRTGETAFAIIWDTGDFD